MRHPWLAILCLLSPMALAQDSQVKKAQAALEAYDNGQVEALDAALEAIERASAHKKTGEKGSVWVLKGKVLTLIALQGGVPEPRAMEDAVNAWATAVEFGAGEGAIAADLERILSAAQTAIRDDLEARNDDVAWGRVQAAILARSLLQSVGWSNARAEAPLLNFSAMAAVRQGEVDRAIEWYDAMVAMGEPSASLAVMIARRVNEDRGVEPTEAFLTAQRKSDPKNPLLLEAHVRLLVEAERGEDAAAAIDAVTALETASPGEALLLGQLNLVASRPEPAEAAFARALARNPELEEAWIPLATLLLEQESSRERTDTAIAWLEKAKDARETLDPAVVSALADAYRRTGRKSDAADLEKALQSQTEAADSAGTMAK